MASGWWSWLPLSTRRSWETAVFLPFEAYEIARHITWLKVLTLLGNLLILTYLVIRRVQEARGGERTLGSRYGNN